MKVKTWDQYRPHIDIITIGFPFCAFKIITGHLCANHYTQTPWAPLASSLGVLFIFWGVIDLMINAINLVALLARGKTLWSACIFGIVAKQLKNHEDWGNSLDVLGSFILVSFMVGGGFIPLISQTEVFYWSWSVVLNVLGAGLGRMVESTRNRT